MSSETAIHVLLVEDNPTDALLVKHALGSEYFYVLGSERLGGALNLLASAQFDVVLLDLGLPDSQGLNTLRTLRRSNPQIAVIVLTGRDDEEMAINALHEGAQDYLVKGDIEPGALKRALRYAVERSGAEKKLRQSEGRLQELTEHIRQVLWVIDAKENKILYVSKGYEEIWGRPCQNLVDDPRSYMDGIHPQDQERMAIENAAMFQSGFIDIETRILRPDATVRWVWIRGNPVRERGQIVRLVGVIEDVTARKALQAQLEQSQKMEVIGLLAGGVAHDFNNMLAVIMGSCKMLEDDATLCRDSRDLIEYVQKAAMQAASLTRQLLAFSRRQILRPKILNLNDVVTEAVAMLGRLIGADIVLKTILHGELWPVKVDAGQMTQVIMNLAVNARDAMAQGGSITIETANVVLDANYLQAFPESKPGQYVVMSISDTGCGMDRETKARIFEPFFTTKETGKGTGLGLATTFGIVKQSGGLISCYSEVGKGTTFKVYLPKDDPAAQTLLDGASSDIKPRPALPRGTETILLVEDEELLRNLTVRILRAQGYDVIEAKDGEEALRLQKRHAGMIDLVLTDVVMPKIGGRELFDRLCDVQPNLKVLFTSGYTDDTAIRHGVFEAETNFIEKPFTTEGLACAVRNVLDKLS